MDYKDIERVNGEMQMIDMKGKAYAMVPERVTAFRKLFPEGFIRTVVLHNDGTTVIMQARVGYYYKQTFVGDDGCNHLTFNEVTLATGLAQETKGKGMVNSTSHIENCETSAVGRALGMLGLGLGGGGICSAEELANAVVAQRQMDADFEKIKKDIEQSKIAELEAKKPVKKDAPTDVVVADRLPI